MKSTTEYAFSMVPSCSIPRSVFDRSHGHKTTFDSGYLVPFLIDEALPGDTFQVRSTLFARLSTPIVPFMDNLHLETFYFAVPYRLVWENWERFNGSRDLIADIMTPPVYEPPYAESGAGWGIGTLEDYMGLPVGIPGIWANVFWHRAYYRIWNDWFRDENLQDALVYPMTDGLDTTGYTLQKRNKRHDYFTSCLPWPQKGPGVPVPMSGQAPVYGTGKALGLTGNYMGTDYLRSISAETGPINLSNGYNHAVDGTPFGPNSTGNDMLLGVPTKPQVDAAFMPADSTGLYADLDYTKSAALTINILRVAFQIQKMHERDARGGTRYTEIIRSHFGVISPDARLQRAEYLGGSSSHMSITPVQQTSMSDPAVTPQGHLAAYGLASDSSGGFSKSFTEHCLIIGLVNVRADLSYQQGLPRKFHRGTREEFYWPSLAHLGEQAVLRDEIYAVGSGVPGQDEEVFGYQERYAEYRYFPSTITGKFRSTLGTAGDASIPYADRLDWWHLAQSFATHPVLGSTFITEKPPLDRVQAVQDEPQIIFDSYISMRCARPMPTYSVPGLIDHF